MNKQELLWLGKFMLVILFAIIMIGVAVGAWTACASGALVPFVAWITGINLVGEAYLLYKFAKVWLKREKRD